LLAEALLGAVDDDPGRLGVRLADLVPAVVLLGPRQRHVAPLHLAPRHGRRGRRLLLPPALRRTTPPAAAPVRLSHLPASAGEEAARALPQLEARELLLPLLQAGWRRQEVVVRVGRRGGRRPLHPVIPVGSLPSAAVSFHASRRRLKALRQCRQQVEENGGGAAPAASTAVVLLSYWRWHAHIKSSSRARRSELPEEEQPTMLLTCMGGTGGRAVLTSGICPVVQYVRGSWQDNSGQLYEGVGPLPALARDMRARRHMDGRH
jgi:hypothetical protein